MYPVVDATAHRLPGHPQLIAVMVDIHTAFGCQTVALSGRLDETLVAELLQRRVRCTRTRAPDTPTSCFDLLHELIPIVGSFGEEKEHGRTRIAASRLVPEGSVTAPSTESKPAKGISSLRRMRALRAIASVRPASSRQQRVSHRQKDNDISRAVNCGGRSRPAGGLRTSGSALSAA